MTRQSLIVGATVGAVIACASGSRSSSAPSPSPVVTAGGVTAPLDSMSGGMGGCPGGNGIRISATSGTLIDSTGTKRSDTTTAKADSTAGPNAVIGLGQAIDTTLVFNFSRKTWTRSNISAAISVGIADESRGRYAICAGVNALLPTATLTITGARGTVHFAADLRQFNNSVRNP
ncbi:MAG TPA: hypothetical protein VLJ83_03880 [Gemmatimonadaceae bacterium]|nr:hypothetical protein [Gemmatimonadaceae bacterium]